jgi:hypothetical protein
VPIRNEGEKRARVGVAIFKVPFRRRCDRAVIEKDGKATVGQPDGCGKVNLLGALRRAREK